MIVPFTPERQKKANAQGIKMTFLFKKGLRSSKEQNLRVLIKNDFGIDFPISGGTGNSLNNPIIIHKVEPNDYVSVEYQILHCLGLGRRIEWKLLQQTLINQNNRKLDQLKIEVKEKTQTETITTIENYYFDITECMANDNG